MDRTTTLKDYCDNVKYAGQSWLYGKGEEWAITPGSNDIVYVIFSSGQITYNISSNGHSFRPVLYLNSSVYKINGDGSLENPYIIGM